MELPYHTYTDIQLTKLLKDYLEEAKYVTNDEYLLQLKEIVYEIRHEMSVRKNHLSQGL